MARALTGIVIALLLANPFCCCAAGFALAGAGSGNGPVDAPAKRSCCHQARTASDTETSPSPVDNVPKAPCQCSRFQRIQGPQGVAKFSPPGEQVKPPPFISVENNFPTPRALLVESPCASAGRHPPPAAGTSLTILYGVFRC